LPEKQWWHSANARLYEPYFSRWMSMLTAKELHSKSDIALVLADKDMTLFQARNEIADLHRALAELERTVTYAARFRDRDRYPDVVRALVQARTVLCGGSADTEPASPLERRR
jgi:hypothetical protein